MSLLEKIQSDMKTAMKEREKIKLSTIRLLISDIKNTEKANLEPLDDEQIIEVIQRQIKRRNESASQYKDAGRLELSEKEEAEKDVLMEYLPEQMSEDEIKDVVQRAINETGAQNPSDMGKVMGKIMPIVKGKADGSKVSAIVKSLLSGK